MFRKNYLILSVLAGFLLVACGGNDTGNTPDEDKTPPSETREVTTETTGGLAESMNRGKTVYESYCQVCHQPEGAGQEGVFPPLAKADYLMADATRAVRQVLYGFVGEMVVNGVTYNNAMPAQGPLLDDGQIADVLNYVMNNWGNQADQIITPDMVATERAKPE